MAQAKAKNANRSLVMVWLVMFTFFVISFLTNIIGPILPDAEKELGLTLTMAGILPFAFFIAYGIMSIPAGYLVEKYREKKVMIAAFVLAAIANFLFVLFPTFYTFLPSLFLVGCGMAMLQVVINPLLRTAGGEEHYSFNSVLAQLIFGLASFVSPVAFSYLVVHLQKADISNPVLAFLNRVVPAGLPWVSIYWVSTLISVLMVIALCFLKFPVVKAKEDEKIEGKSVLLSLLSNKTVIFFFFGIFAYVGTEQGFSNWISKFLETYHGYDPDTVGAQTLSYFWLMMTVGGLLGLALLKLFDVKKVFGGSLLLTFVALSFALFGSGKVALIAFPACGFMLSVMYPSIFSLGLNSLPSHHGTFAGILCAAIMGGAVVPLIIGALGDALGLKTAMSVLYITLLYMFSIAVFAKPLVQNETIFSTAKE
ncbi:MAG: MFS transporter [Candidatus Omnitrophica bacterium]|nr:MFS transporter [Candidatus Omnitrophota bacterium]